MKHLGNTLNPANEEDAKRGLALSHHEMHDPNGMERAWERHLDYLDGKTLSRPHSWRDCSDTELIESAQLVLPGMLDGKGTLLEQMGRYAAKCPSAEELEAQGFVGVYIEE